MHLFGGFLVGVWVIPRHRSCLIEPKRIGERLSGGYHLRRMTIHCGRHQQAMPVDVGFLGQIILKAQTDVGTAAYPNGRPQHPFAVTQYPTGFSLKH